MRVFAFAAAALLLAGCASSGTPKIRGPEPAEEKQVRDALTPLLTVSGICRGPQDGCAVLLGVWPFRRIYLAVGPDPRYKFALEVTTGALRNLDPDELQTALAHELGHVELGHFATREARREAERKTGQDGKVDPQTIAQNRTYDRDEEIAADRYAVELLDKLPGPPGHGCASVMNLIERIDLERLRPAWSSWLSDHPTPGVRLAALQEICPKRP